MKDAIAFRCVLPTWAAAALAALVGCSSSAPIGTPPDAPADPAPLIEERKDKKTAVVDLGTATRFIVPQQDLPSAEEPLGWVAFDYGPEADAGKDVKARGKDSNVWQEGSFGIGFGDDDDATTVKAKEGVPVIYTRTAFTVEDPTILTGLLLHIDYDDAFAAWINGAEVARSANLVGLDLTRDTRPTRGREAIGALDMRIDLSSHLSTLVAGENILAMAVWNVDPDSDDLTLSPRLTTHTIAPADPAQPFHTILTWEGDTSTSMTVNFQTWTTGVDTQVRYDTESRQGDAGAYRYVVDATTATIPGLDLYSPRAVHHGRVTGLNPDTRYYFVAGSEETGFTSERSFRTMPREGRTVRFVTGGDMGVSSEAFQLMRQAAEAGPDFVAIGGDVAYANGELRHYGRWDKWLGAWERYMVNGAGLTIPAVVAIGNHEVQGGMGQTADKAPFWHHYLAQGGSTSFVRRFSNDLAMVVLDTGHIQSPEDQTEWLGKALHDVDDAAYTVALYHIPLYPGHRSFDGAISAAGREHWAPVFDTHRLTAAFENHDHVFKRTHPMRGGEVVAEGTVYLGDGAMGVEPRAGKQSGARYLARLESHRHFWLVDTNIAGDDGKIGLRAVALDEHGKRFDEVHLPRR